MGKVVTRLAVVGKDGVIYVSDEALEGWSELSPPEFSSSWPTWSPDGLSLAYSRFRPPTNGDLRLSLCVSTLDGESGREVHVNQSGTDAISERTPHYMLWSPDGSAIAIVAQTLEKGLTLFLADGGAESASEEVLGGGPLFVSWSNDSRHLLAHAHQLHYLVISESRDVAQVPVTSQYYMSPCWNPVRPEMAMLGELVGSRQALMLGNVEEGGSRILSEVEGAVAMAYRPDGEAIAICRELDRGKGYYSGLWLYDAITGEADQLYDGRLLSFFWSPDGSLIALVVPSETGEGSIRWATLDLESRNVTYHEDFRPSRSQLTTFMFFDQYRQSHSPWSPDGSRLVFAGELGHQIRRTALPNDSATKVLVLDPSTGDTKQVSEGLFGTWSPTSAA